MRTNHCWATGCITPVNHTENFPSHPYALHFWWICPSLEAPDTRLSAQSWGTRTSAPWQTNDQLILPCLQMTVFLRQNPNISPPPRHLYLPYTHPNSERHLSSITAFHYFSPIPSTVHTRTCILWLTNFPKSLTSLINFPFIRWL